MMFLLLENGFLIHGCSGSFSITSLKHLEKKMKFSEVAPGAMVTVGSKVVIKLSQTVFANYKNASADPGFNAVVKCTGEPVRVDLQTEVHTRVIDFLRENKGLYPKPQLAL